MKHLIWDLDGTLIDSYQEILFHFKASLHDASLNINDVIKPIRTGPPVDVMLKESFPSEILTEDKIKEVLLYFRKRYDTSNFSMTNSYDGIDDFIMNNNFFHYIVTNKPEYPTKLIIKKLKWEDRIIKIKTPPNDIINRKTKTELFSEIINETRVNIKDFIAIGDMKTDCIAAKENGITAIGVLWGTGTREELAECSDLVFEDIEQLKDYLYAKGNV